MTDTTAAALRAVDGRFSWATELLRELVAVPSVTGEEAAAQAIVAQALGGLGLVVDSWCPRRDEVASHPSFSDDGLPLGDRPVVVGTWDPAPGGSTLVLNGHIDTVPAGDITTWSVDPWSGGVRDDRLYGRGACDMKGGLVAAILAVAAVREAGVAPAMNVMVQSVIGEESGGVGTLAALQRGHTGDAAIVVEPTGMDVCPVGAGAASFRLTVPGLAAHGALRRQGVSALEKLIVLADALGRLEQERHTRFRHPAFADGELIAPISIGKVFGGDWPSTVPDRVVAEGRFGIFPGETLDEGRAELHAAIDAAGSADSWLAAHRPTVEWFEGQFAPAETTLDAGLVTMVSAAHERVTGRVAVTRGVPYGSDLRFFTNDAGIPAVLYGPGDASLAHAADEYVPLAEVRAVAKVLALTLLQSPEAGFGSTVFGSPK